MSSDNVYILDGCIASDGTGSMNCMTAMAAMVIRISASEILRPPFRLPRMGMGRPFFGIFFFLRCLPEDFFSFFPPSSVSFAGVRAGVVLLAAAPFAFPSDGFSLSLVHLSGGPLHD
jgi:hypothetical protein